MKKIAAPLFVVATLGVVLGAMYSLTIVGDKRWGVKSDVALSKHLELGHLNCPPFTVEVKGNMKQDLPGYANSVEELQKTTCTRWLNRGYPERCLQFDEEAWGKLAATLPTTPMHFCIDRFEYPNVMGENPIISITHVEGDALCQASGKRLCTEDEWSFACEGEAALPYPYGFARDSVACNIDKPWRVFSERKLARRGTTEQRNELDRLWQGEPSGSREGCVSPFGVYDMTGNVDEWTTATKPSKHRSILKGGYWGPVRTRCRPSTRNHEPGHFFYQQGVRCCADPTNPSQ